MTQSPPSPADRTRTCHNCADRRLTSAEETKRGQCRYCALADTALFAFWETLASRFPEAKSGDLSPERTIGLHTAATIAVEEWISNNVLPQEGDDPEAPIEPTSAALKEPSCRTCGSAIIFLVNDSIFHAGDCGRCERRRYCNSTGLIKALTAIRDATESLDNDDSDLMHDRKATQSALDKIRGLANVALSRNADFRESRTS